ncbi:MAG: hypothetical protein K6G88_11665 [Lachnospiraceae bacterium]|nr:hypothetical protein [Lachnospiraceae bacterium]
MIQDWEDKELKDYKGFGVFKRWEVAKESEIDKGIKVSKPKYYACDDDDVINEEGCDSLKELKKLIDEYVK